MEEYEDAMYFIKNALDIDLEFCGINSIEATTDYDLLGEIYMLLSKYEEAEKCYQYALEGRKNIFGPNHILVYITYAHIAQTYSQRKIIVQAIEYYNKALDVLIKLKGEKDPDVETMKELIEILKYRKKLEDAINSAH